MSSDVPDRPPAGRLLETLRVRRNVLVGLATGVALALALFAVRVFELLGPAPDRGSTPLFFGLALVLALSAAGLVAAALTAATAVRVATRTADATEDGAAAAAEDGAAAAAEDGVDDAAEGGVDDG